MSSLSQEISLIITTIDCKDAAKKLIKSLISQKLAVCALTQDISSTYHWNDEIQESKEYLITFKTLNKLSQQLRETIEKEHSYDTCFVAEIKTDHCNLNYLNYAKSYLLKQ